MKKVVLKTYYYTWDIYQLSVPVFTVLAFIFNPLCLEFCRQIGERESKNRENQVSRMLEIITWGLFKLLWSPVLHILLDLAGAHTRSETALIAKAFPSHFFWSQRYLSVLEHIPHSRHQYYLETHQQLTPRSLQLEKSLLFPYELFIAHILY